MSASAVSAGATGRALDALIVQAQRAALTIVARGEAVVESAIKAQFTASHAKGTATPSSPGSAPAVVSGTLRRSVKSDPARPDGPGAVGRVYPTAVYARIQELGGDAGRNHATHLPARPYVQPALASAQEELTAIGVEGWGQLTR